MENNISKIFTEFNNIKGTDTRSRFYMPPAKILRTYGCVKNASALLDRAEFQAQLSSGAKTPCTMINTESSEKAGVLIDYGREIHGCVRIVITTTHKNGDNTCIPFKARIRFGESISEAITPIGIKNSRNDHAIRDTITEISFMSANDTSETGFRYFYFEIEDEDIAVNISSLGAVLIINDFPYLGSFESSDDRLNQIWKTSAYTVQLCTQHYFWDGIKRDRIVWLGDMNTEICTAFAVFGNIPQIRNSLDYGVETTPLPQWMNTIPSYSFWWILNLYEYYIHTGDVLFLNKHRDYISGLTKQIFEIIHEDGSISEVKKFIDWSTAHDETLKNTGFYGILGLTLLKLPVILGAIDEKDLAEECALKHRDLRKNPPKPAKQKIASALLSLGGLSDKITVNDILSRNCAEGYSTFMGYSILNAKSLAGDFGGAISAIKEYWGTMLDMGATTFWEDFDLEWAKNAYGINEFPIEGKDDIHGDFGKHCYIKLRHSLCHGWSSGPCPWLTENVLGIHILEPGMKKILIKPYLGELEFANGNIPTPYGILSVSISKDSNGNIITNYIAPKEIEIILQ